MTDLMNYELNNDKAVCRTAPTTPGLLKPSHLYIGVKTELSALCRHVLFNLSSSTLENFAAKFTFCTSTEFIF